MDMIENCKFWYYEKTIPPFSSIGYDYRVV